MNAEIHMLTGAYAMDALSGPERADFEQHLAHCGACAAEVTELRETAARLGFAVTVSPPPELKRQVLAAAARTRQLPPLVSAEPARPVVPRWQLWTATAAAAACLVAAVVFGAQWAAVQRELDQNDRQVAQAEQRLDSVLTVLAAPDAKVSTATVGDTTATTVVSQSRGKVAFLARGMPDLPSDRSYQLWLIGPGGMESAGVLTAGSDPAPLVADLAAGHSGLGVTVEPRGGSASPTTDPVMQFELPA